MEARRKVAFAIPLVLFLVALRATVALSQDTEAVAASARWSVGVLLVEGGEGGIGSGTAFMVADGLALTARHVVAGARKTLLRFPDRAPVEPSVLRLSDEATDLAVLSVPGQPVRPLPLGDSAKVREGQRIVVIGYPRIDVLGAMSPTVTDGIVSASRPGVLQMQAPVNPGNSGGPVLNLGGEVVGIVRSTLRGAQQVNFATASNAAKPLLLGALPAPGAPDAFLIRPGQSIGPIALGPIDVEAALGPPMKQFDMGGGVVSYWWRTAEASFMNVFVTPEKEAILVAVTNDPRFATAEGLRVGSSEAEVKAALGPAVERISQSKSDKYLRFDSLGLFFIINLDARYQYYQRAHTVGAYSKKVTWGD